MRTRRNDPTQIAEAQRLAREWWADNGEGISLSETQIENATGLGHAAASATQNFGTKPWWRGQSVSTWQLQPSVFRVDDPGHSYEQNIAQHFMLGARSRHQNCPDDHDASNWLFLMQHYGLPTRLLDWTQSILVAAHFAVRHEKYDHEDGAVWALKGTALNQEQVGNPQYLSPVGSPARDLFREALGVHKGKPSNCIVATNSHQTDIRMMVQLSEFTLHGTSAPIEELPNNDKFLMQFIIPKAEKPALRGLLTAFGISESSLFPDLAHLAADLKKQRYSS